MVGVVLQVERNRSGYSRVGQCGCGLVGVRPTLAIAIELLENLGGTREAVRNVGVQRQVGVLVDLACDLLAVDEVGNGLANGESLGRVGLRVVAPKGWVSKLKTM